MSKGGNRTRDGRRRLARGTPCGSPSRDGSADKRWRTADKGVVQVDGRSAPRPVVGGVAGENRY